jgi:hypothetical protein
MAQTLDVLVMESHPHAADEAVAALVAAAHRVHRCHEPGGRSFPCVGLTNPGACPLDRGIDVALLVRRRIAPRPTPWEGGVSCVIRAGVPLIEEGPEILDPFEPWVTARSDGDVVAACSRVLEEGRSTARRLRKDDIRDRCTTGGGSHEHR